MEKEFNITGNCRPAKHYMADVSGKLAQTMKMVEKGNYFIINRPRQYGKTTTLFTIDNMLVATGNYIVFNISFEGIGDIIFNTEEAFSRGFVEILATYAKYQIPELADWLSKAAAHVHDLKALSNMITDLTLKTDKKVVLLIDEVDKSSNNQLFISFLAMLRNKYLLQDKVKTFHSIILAGVHDVKSLKLKMRPDEEGKYNSPWNIASEFKVDMNLQVFEIKPMLEEYARDKSVKMDTQLMAEQLFYYTSGYPFLVSKLCKMLDEDIMKNGEWTVDDVESAAKKLVNEANTNFDSLIKNLENNQDLYDAVYEVAIASDFVPFSVHSPIISLGILLGIFVAGNGGGRVVIHNRIYVEVIVNYMIDKMRRAELANRSDLGSGYKNDDKTLNMEAVLLGFQTFMKKEYSKKDRNFLEKNGRLVFLAFLKPIINGSGYDFKEPQISEEKRLDLVITYLHQKFVAELKLWYGPKAHEKGLEQLTDYLDRQSLDTGYLLIFDHSETKKWHSEWIETAGKKIFVVWV
jgi:hypothetical protein